MYQETLTYIDIKQIKIEHPQVIYSMYIPLGENGIIQLVDKFRENNAITIIETDLYYFVEIEFKRFQFSFYSRGLVQAKYTPKDDYLWRVLYEIEEPKQAIVNNLEELLDTYQLSLISMFDEIKNIPVHVTITTSQITNLNNTNYYSSTQHSDQKIRYNRELLQQIADQELFKEFMGYKRVIGNYEYEEVIIGTHGSLVRTDQLDTLITYHTYIRALHLFLNEYYTITQDIWEELNGFEGDLYTFINHNSQNSSLSLEELFSAEKRLRLSKIKSEIFNGVQNIDQFLILIKFIQGSIESTHKGYLEIRDKKQVKENSFHIRNVLSILNDRAKGTAIISENLVSQATSIISRLDLLDSEIAYEKQQRFELITFFSGIVSIVVALIAVFVSF